MSQITHVPTDLGEISNEVISSVFTTLLETDLVPAELPSEDLRFPVVGTIYFLGDWEGAVIMSFEENLAFDTVAQLLKTAKPTQVDQDVRDIVGELVNMIAGNLRPMMPGDTHMSMPSVVHGSDFQVSVLGSNECARMAYQSTEGMLLYTLVRTQDRQGA